MVPQTEHVGDTFTTPTPMVHVNIKINNLQNVLVSRF